MKVTDEMVEAAFEMFASKTIWNRNAMRAALEAALVARGGDGPALINRLRRACFYQNVTGEVRTFRSDASNGLVVDAADCIEDLAGALKENEFVATAGPLTTDGYRNAFEQIRARSRAALERWGLK